MTVALHHVDDGPADAPVVVLLPSLGATHRSWDGQVAPLVAAGLRVIAVDARGHGASPVPDGPYAVADLGADVLALLDRLGARRAHVVGLSLGGATALWLAAEHPDRVDRLVAACTSADFGEPGPWRERAATVRAHGTGSIAATVVRRWLPEAEHAARADELAALEAMVAATPAEGYAACCEAIAACDLGARLGAIAAPTLVLGGREDPATPPGHQERIAAAVPGARLELLDNAAHLAHLSRPDLFARLVAGHLTA